MQNDECMKTQHTIYGVIAICMTLVACDDEPLKPTTTAPGGEKKLTMPEAETRLVISKDVMVETGLAGWRCAKNGMSEEATAKAIGDAYEQAIKPEKSTASMKDTREPLVFEGSAPGGPPVEKPSLSDRLDETISTFERIIKHQQENLEEKNKWHQKLADWIFQLMQQSSTREVVLEGPMLEPGGGHRYITIHENKDGTVTLKSSN